MQVAIGQPGQLGMAIITGCEPEFYHTLGQPVSPFGQTWIYSLVLCYFARPLLNPMAFPHGLAVEREFSTTFFRLGLLLCAIFTNFAGYL